MLTACLLPLTPQAVFSRVPRTRISKSTWFGKVWVYWGKRTFWVRKLGRTGVKSDGYHLVLTCHRVKRSWRNISKTHFMWFLSGESNKARVQRPLSCKMAPEQQHTERARSFGQLPQGPYSQLHLWCAPMATACDHQPSGFGQILSLLLAVVRESAASESRWKLHFIKQRFSNTTPRSCKFSRSGVGPRKSVF